eukprot:1019875-Prorocentrum_minimum.AAC.3
MQLDREKKKNYAYVEEIRMLKEQSIEVVRAFNQVTKPAKVNDCGGHKSGLYVVSSGGARGGVPYKYTSEASTDRATGKGVFTNMQPYFQFALTVLCKVELERQLEDEKEYIVNKLQKQLDELARARSKLNKEKVLSCEPPVDPPPDPPPDVLPWQIPNVDLENQLEAEQEYIVNKLQKQASIGTFSDLDDLATGYWAQLEGLAHEKVDMMRERELMRKQVQDLKSEKDRVNLEKVSVGATVVTTQRSKASVGATVVTTQRSKVSVGATVVMMRRSSARLQCAQAYSSVRPGALHEGVMRGS